MAFARCKVYCSNRQVVPVSWQIHRQDGEGKPLAIQMMGEVSPEGKCYRTFTFTAPYSADPADENKAFWEATPAFNLMMSVTNANVDFVVGQTYYLDFVRGERQSWSVAAPGAER